MVNVSLRHVHVVRRTLADGTSREYHYAWKGRGAPRLVGVPGSAEYLASYQRAHTTNSAARHLGTLTEILTAYRGSPEFKRLSGHSLRAYQTYLDVIQKRFGELPHAALDDHKVRRHFLRWRDEMADRPRTADYAIGVLKRLLAWAEERSFVRSNQAKPISRLHNVDRSDAIWTEEELNRFRAVASREVRWALDLALHTGLRQSDLIKLGRSDFDGTSFIFRTSKRGREVLIPATPALQALLRDIESCKAERAVTKQPVGRKVVSLERAQTERRAAEIILSTQRGGRPWTADGLRSSFTKTKEAAKVTRTFHDLRRTAATRLLIAGVEGPTVALLMGWSEKAVEALKRKYVSRRAVAEAIGARLNVNADAAPVALAEGSSRR